jgi:uracil-DNA glycosylase
LYYEAFSKQKGVKLSISGKSENDINEYELKHLKNKTHYDIVVRAVNSRGIGKPSNIITIAPNGNIIASANRNIFSELESDLSIPIHKNGNLESWAKQGVLLLNTCLTVEESKPGSHQNIGWEEFTDAILQNIGYKGSVVFMLWGAKAQAKESIIYKDNNLIIKSAHPSPFSARRGFFGSKPFSRANAFLKSNGKNEINWNLDI